MWLRCSILSLFVLLLLSPLQGHAFGLDANVANGCYLHNYRNSCGHTASTQVRVDGGKSYVFSTLIKEGSSLNSTNNALFTVELYDQWGNFLGQDVPIERMTWSTYLGGKWYSYMNGRSSELMTTDFQPTNEYKLYQKVVALPANAFYARIRVYNLGSVPIHVALTTFSKMNYLSESEIGVKGMALFYLNSISRLSENYGLDDTAAEALLSYLARRDPEGNIVDKLFDGIILLHDSHNTFRIPGEPAGPSHHTKETWELYLDQLFVSLRDYLDMDQDQDFDESVFPEDECNGSYDIFCPPALLTSLNWATRDLKQALDIEDYKVKFFVTIPIPIDQGGVSPPIFGDVDDDGHREMFSNDADKRKIVTWFIEETLRRWNDSKNLYPHISLAGFYFNDEYPLSRNRVMAETAKVLTRTRGLKLIHSPYRKSDTNNPTSFLSSYFDGIYVQPNYFPGRKADSTIPVLAKMMLYPGLHNGGINLEWTSNDDERAILPYLDIVKSWGIADQVSFMNYDNGGRIYLCDPQNRDIAGFSACVVDGRDIYQEIANVLGRAEYGDLPTTVPVPIPIPGGDVKDVSTPGVVPK